ncbi:unnamed protein product [Dibothriocephalus latus]|uniref:Uncharacterized protein n=1 Tax=Dibothriocephalus latus TaxID=60516 RepID=A0A3P6TIE4_DIBLA|nr:unnamed protein product [Dibothriocephalus latus]
MGAVFETISLTLWDVTVAIRRFRQSHIPVPDGIPVNLLKAKSNDIFLSFLRKIYNLALESETFPMPEELELELERSHSFTNQCTTRRLEEKMMRHLAENNLLNAAEHGFLEKMIVLTIISSFENLPLSA